MSPPVAETQHNVAELNENLKSIEIDIVQLPDKDEQEGNCDAKDENYFLGLRAVYTFLRVPHIADGRSRVPPKLPKIVAEQIDVEDDGADDGKGQQPYSGTDGKGDWCPGKLSVEVSVRDESYRADQSDGSHREEVSVGDEVADQC